MGLLNSDDLAFDLTTRTPPPPALMPDVGDLVAGKYRLEQLIGKGSMGSVYVARHERLDRHVALKFIAEEHAQAADYARRFLNEARAAAGIENEHVARILDAGELGGGVPFMVLELLHGADLAHLLEQAITARRPLPIGQVVDWVLQSLEGVAEAHALGIVHRDLKPANLFLANRRDGSSIVKVLDFGISKASRVVASTTLTATASLLGSPVYMAPEQLRDAKNVDGRADLWSLGVVLYEMVTGRLPFDADSVAEVFVAVLERTPKPMRALRSDVPPELERVVMRCLTRDPKERFQNAAELAEALAPFAPIGSFVSVRRVRHLTQHAWELRREPIPPPPTHRSRLLPVVAVVALAAAAALGLVESGVVTTMSATPGPAGSP